MKYLHLIIFSLLFSACAGAVTPVPTVTNTLNPPTVTATFTLVPTITPTAVPPITDLTAWEKSEGDRIAKEAGFANYAEYVQKKLVENLAYDTEPEYGGSTYEPHTFVSAEGLVMEQATIPVLSEYWKGKGAEKAEVLLMAFEHTTQPISVLAGFYLKDGKYVSMLPLEVGADVENYSQDKFLKKPEDLKRLVGQLRSVRAVVALAPSPDYDFDDYSHNWDKLIADKDVGNVAKIYHDVIGVRSVLELDYFEYALYNPEGYMRTMNTLNMLNNPPEELQAILGAKNTAEERYVVPGLVYNLTRGGGVDSWMVVTTLGQNGHVKLR